MTALPASYKTVRYDLRPAKQAQRLMLIDAFRRFEAVGMDIASCRYVGMGSVHYYDFSLFHRFVGFTSMLNVEGDTGITKRIGFNKPYAFIDVEMQMVGDVLPKLDSNVRHVLWLDYDDRVTKEIVADIFVAMLTLKTGSILLITLDVEPPKGCTEPVQTKEYYEAEIPSYLSPSAALPDFARANLSALNASIISKVIDDAVLGRKEGVPEPFVNFAYEDGHRMLTIGVVIASDKERSVVRKALDGTVYYRSKLDGEHCEIRIPVLTRKEQGELDAGMPAGPAWLPPFEIDADDLAAYRDLYRFVPRFGELMV